MAAEHEVLVVQKALEDGLLSEDDPLVLFTDLNALERAVADVKRAFEGNHFLHCFAVKANPTLEVLKFLHQNGMGLETASNGELHQALKAASPQFIVFDSPIKTLKEIKIAIENRVHVNLDNFQELERFQKTYNSIYSQKEQQQTNNNNSHVQYIGLRINPQCGAGTIKTHSTSVSTGKFGFGLDDFRDRIIEAYKANNWLNSIHVHVGSQGIGFEMAVIGIKAVVELALEINEILKNDQIKCIDIGGGLSVNFSDSKVTPTFQEYADFLSKKIPQLFTGQFFVLTEFGRSIVAKAGWFGSRIEYTKTAGGRPIATQHAGADICIRTVYHPEKWPLAITVLDHKGHPKVGELVKQDVAGPCCIAGDIIAHERELPLIEQNDVLIINDVGGYYHASYSRYNSRQCPGVLGYKVVETEKKVQWVKLQSKETLAQSVEIFCRT